MFTCPRCGSIILHPPKAFETHVCRNCGAVLERARGIGGLLGDVRVVGDTHSTSSEEAETGGTILSETEAEVKWRSEHPEYYTPSAYCGRCKTGVMTSDAEFCPRCGSRLHYAKKGTTPPRTKAMPEARKRATSIGRGERCIVCNLALGKKDDVVYCPHCGRPAHRDHLIAWIEKKKACPICGEYLNEQDY